MNVHIFIRIILTLLLLVVNGIFYINEFFMKKLILILLIALNFSSCATLSKSQIASINQFGVTTSEFSAYPGKIMTELADVREKRGLFYASTIEDPRLHISELDSIFKQKDFDYRASEKVDLTFRIIDKYAQSLIVLSADEGQNFELHGQHLGLGIDSLITQYNRVDNTTNLPVGIGEAVAQLVVSGANQYVKRRQAKEIKRFVTEADTLVDVMTSNLLEYLRESVMQDLIAHEEAMIRRDYLTYLQHEDSNTFHSQKEYLELKNSIAKIKLLKEQTIQATENLQETHEKLVQIIRQRQKLKHMIKELQIFHQQVTSIRNTILELEAQNNDSYEH